MVGGRDRGRGRDGFGSGRYGRGAGRTYGRQDYSWRRRDGAPVPEPERVPPEQGQTDPERGRQDPPVDLGQMGPLPVSVQQEGGAGGRSKWDHRPEMQEDSAWKQQDKAAASSSAIPGEIPPPDTQHTPVVLPVAPLHAPFVPPAAYQNYAECFRCGEKGHGVQDCRHPKKCSRCGIIGHIAEHCRTPLFSDYVAPFCAAQVEGQGFFSIPDFTSENTVKEKATTAVISVLSGNIKAKHIEQEFKAIVPVNIWRWSAKKLDGNRFSVRFPNAQLIREWGHFSPMRMKTCAGEITIEPWTGAVGAKAELQQGWFRVRGIPYDKRNEKTLAYVGSLVGATVDIDSSCMSNREFVRLKICCRDVTKVPASVEGAIIPFLYDFFYEREISIPAEGQDGGDQAQSMVIDEQHQAKKPKTGSGGSGAPTSGNAGNQAKNSGVGWKSAPAKVNQTSAIHQAYSGSGTFMLDAKKTYVDKGKAAMVDESDRLKIFDELPSDDDDMICDGGAGMGNKNLRIGQVNTFGLMKCDNPNQTEMLKDIAVGSGPEGDTQKQQVQKNPEVFMSNKGDDGVTEAQRIPETRQSTRIQENIIREAQEKISKKRSFEGIQGADMEEIMKTGAAAMLQAAVTVMQRQGRGVTIQPIQDGEDGPKNQGYEMNEDE